MGAPKQIKTDRLVLHAPLEVDRVAFHRFCASKRRIAMQGKITREDMDARFDRYLATWEQHKYGRYVMHQDGVAVGMVGLTPYPGAVELSWYVWHADDEGKGYAFEAASAVLDMANKTLGLGPLVSYIDPGNDRSIALATRLGATLEEGTPPADFLSDHHIYRHKTGGCA